MSARPSVRVQAAVVGGGVIGCSILWELTKRGIGAILVEAEPDVCEGTSKANSAIVHTGFDSKPGTVESTMLRRAAGLWPGVIEELGVPFLSLGAIMLARTGDERDRLASQVALGAAALGVATELLDRAAIRDQAPFVTDDAVAALSIPEEGVIDPFWLTRAYAEASTVGGAEVILGRAVVGLDVGDDGVAVLLEDGMLLQAEQVFDCAGLAADEVASLAGDRSFAIAPRRGQFLVSEETFGVDRIVLPIPGPMGKGMLVTPIVFGGLLLGPTAVDQVAKDDRSTDPAEAARILQACRAMVPALAGADPIHSFAGLRHVSSTGDYIIRPSAAGNRLYLVAGIRSTGISASPAVAAHAVAEAGGLRSWSVAEPRRLVVQPQFELSEQPGGVVCPCRGVSRGEIEQACRRPIPPSTLDAVKRRGGAMFGDCQGNLCAVDVATIVAAERGVTVTAIEKGPRGSRLFVGTSTERSQPPAPAPVPAGPVDAVVIGRGEAGSAAAAAIGRAGWRAAVLDRLDGPTVIGLSPMPEGWSVLAVDDTGSVEIACRSVVLATGGYVEPREHRGIAGPRPAGVITADFAAAARRSGLCVGEAVVVVGSTRRAAALAAGYERDRALVEVIGTQPDEVRGRTRVESVRVGGRWIACDTLILADRVIPNAMLLRSVGLVDGRPGIAAPADAHGRLPLPGLWAVGCCVKPSIDHETCREDGGRVGGSVAVSLAEVAGA